MKKSRPSFGQCPYCGAPLPSHAVQCKYCQSRLSAVAAPQPRPATEDFGWQGIRVLKTGAGGVLVFYILGWLLEDTTYWLDRRAVLVWGGLLPLWMFGVALSWRPDWGGWLPGFAVAIPLFAIHLGIAWLFHHHINDDLVGIAAMFAGGALLGWLLGRGLHLWIRRMRAQARLNIPNQQEK